MADIKMVALKGLGGFKAKDLQGYVTRRLKAGDQFMASPQLSYLLSKLGRARAIREPGTVAKPPAEVLARAAAVTPPQPAERVVEPPKPVAAMSTATAPTGRKATRRRARAKK